MKRIFCLISVFLLIFAVAACSGKKTKEEKLELQEEVAQEISAEEGGTIKNSDDSVSIEIPAKALASNTKITMKIYNVSAFTSKQGEILLNKVVEFEPSGTIFKKPVLISMINNENIKNKVITAAVFNTEKGEWSYSETGAAVQITGRTGAGDPIMMSAGGDPIMLNAAGDPIMMDAAGDPIMLSAAGDPIMVTAAGDPIMNSAAGDPIMMTTGHFSSYTFIALDPEDEKADTYVTENGCTGMSISLEDLTYKPSLFSWSIGEDPMVKVFFNGDEGLTTPKVGTYDLGSGNNANYATCTECVLVHSDFVDETYKTFFQESGTIVVKSYNETSKIIEGTISARLVEVTMDDNTLESTPVPDGACFEIETEASQDNDTDTYVTENGCTGMSISLEDLTYKPSLFSWSIGEDPMVKVFFNGDEGLTTPKVGTYDLGSGNNANYATCTECVLVHSDFVDETYKTFFQESGTIVVKSYNETSKIIEGTISARLVEVTMDDNTLESTPVPDGACFEIETPVSDPNTDENRCIGMSIDLEDLDFSQTTYSWSTGEDPLLQISFYGDTGIIAPEVGTYDLGSGYNANYATCTECVLVYSDWADENFTRTFFQESGNLKIESYDETTNIIKGTLSAKLVEVIIEQDNETYESTTVPNGACFEVEAPAN